MSRGLFASLFICFYCLVISPGCGNDNSERNRKKKAVADSIRRSDSLEKNKGKIEAMKHSEEDSVLSVKEFESNVAKYDSLRNMDSLKVKWKHLDPIKPAPKRDLWAKSPIK